MVAGAVLLRRDALLDARRAADLRRHQPAARRGGGGAACGVPRAVPGLRGGRRRARVRAHRAVGRARGARVLGGRRTGETLDSRRVPVGAARLEPGRRDADRADGQPRRRLRPVGAGRVRVVGTGGRRCRKGPHALAGACHGRDPDRRAGRLGRMARARGRAGPRRQVDHRGARPGQRRADTRSGTRSAQPPSSTGTSR